MSCKCTEDKETIGNVIIGRNKVTCQECLDRYQAEQAKKLKDDEIAEKKRYLQETDYKILKKLEKLLPADDADVLDRQGKRDRINILKG
jgi:putative IMPACT (imprinted ancient) family translation regulator